MCVRARVRTCEPRFVTHTGTRVCQCVRSCVGSLCMPACVCACMCVCARVGSLFIPACVCVCLKREEGRKREGENY